jgi:hypothetical protein
LHRGGGLCSQSPAWSQYSSSPDYSTYITNYRRHSALGLVTVTNDSHPGSNKSITSSIRNKNNSNNQINTNNNTTITQVKEDRTNHHYHQQQQQYNFPNIPQAKSFSSKPYLADIHLHNPSSSQMTHYKPYEYLPGTTQCDMHAGLVSLQNATVRMNQVPNASNCMQNPLPIAHPRQKLPENNINGGISTYYPMPEMLEDLSDLDDLV